jgi:hypothetical protein
MRTYVGIDPGLHGAIAVIDGAAGTRVYDIGGSLQDAANILRTISQECAAPVVCMEGVHSMPNMNCAAVFDFGQTVGFLKGMLAGLNMPLLAEPTPTQWKRAVGIPLNPPKLARGASLEERKQHKARLAAYKRDQKTVARDRARQVFPALCGELNLVKYADRAEAVLLAYYLMITDGRNPK